LFLDEDRLEELWPDSPHKESIYGAIYPLKEGVGDVASPHVEVVCDRIGLIVGDLQLAQFEGDLSDNWPKSLDRDPRAFRVLSSFYRVLDLAAQNHQAELVLIDVGPNLGALNRAAIIAADFVAVPLAPDLFSLQGLRNLGPSLRSWREQWRARLEKAPDRTLKLPSGEMRPIGYIATQHAVRQDRPTVAYNRWMDRIPGEYRRAVLNDSAKVTVSVDQDPYRLAQLKHYRSLMPMAMEAHKPMFLLKPADGAIGAHTQAVRSCYQDFERLAIRLAERCDIQLPVAETVFCFPSSADFA
jgi:cellulose biosynthesis protein BcsQ